MCWDTLYIHIHEKSPTDKCRHIDSSSTSEAYQDGSSWGLTVFQIMSGLCVWRKEAVKLHSSVCAWGYVCLCIQSSQSSWASVPCVLDLQGYFPHLGLLCRFQQVDWQLTIVVGKSLHHMMWVCVCVSVCVLWCLLHFCFMTHQKGRGVFVWMWKRVQNRFKDWCGKHI